MFTNLDETNIYVILMMVFIPMIFVGFFIPIIKRWQIQKNSFSSGFNGTKGKRNLYYKK